MKKNMVLEKSFSFSINIIHLYKYLIEEHKEYVLAKQVLRSGTSVGANIRESQNAESKKDFIHKLAISQKECDESIYWLELLVATNYISTEKFNTLFNEASQLHKLLKSIILSAKKGL
ncbi:four helix bundle protein [Ferruginibacter yonginensis]|uniref:Four helix bundle protein n=1 Tax=Ferruginibacter yonginensis TaxID=1310416 RepID=A0ABV8QN91_9BACT